VWKNIFYPNTVEELEITWMDALCRPKTAKIYKLNFRSKTRICFLFGKNNCIHFLNHIKAFWTLIWNCLQTFTYWDIFFTDPSYEIVLDITFTKLVAFLKTYVELTFKCTFTHPMWKKSRNFAMWWKKGRASIFFCLSHINLIGFFHILFFLIILVL